MASKKYRKKIKRKHEFLKSTVDFQNAVSDFINSNGTMSNVVNASIKSISKFNKTLNEINYSNKNEKASKA